MNIDHVSEVYFGAISLVVKNVEKWFGGLHAVKGVSFNIRQGLNNFLTMQDNKKRRRTLYFTVLDTERKVLLI